MVSPVAFAVKTETSSFCAMSLVVLVLGGASLTDAQAIFRHRLEALKTKLLSNYSGYFAPFNQTQEDFPVHVIFSLVATLDLNSAQQILSTLSYIMVEWTDPDLAWDPAEVGSPGEGIHEIHFYSDDIWTPKLFMPNRIGDQVVDEFGIINVNHRGLCNAHLPMKLDTTCQVDVTRYPFDTQVCQIMFGSLYGENIKIYAHMLDILLLKFFEVSGEWELMDTVINPRNISDNDIDLLYSFVEFQLTLRRRYFFYLLTVIFPILVLSITGACGFLLPLECGEKVSFQVAIMVSLSVFLSFINDNMPKTSLSNSRLAIYLDMLLAQSCLSFLATLTVLRGHYHVQNLKQKDRERRNNKSSEPVDQNMNRENIENPSESHSLQTVTSRARRLMTCLRRIVRRWYCLCCCVPPHLLDKLFFIIFMAGALGSPLIMVVL